MKEIIKKSSENKQNIHSIGFILDGNRRWAVKNNKEKTKGHKEGVKTLLKTIDWVKDLGIEHATFYVFSTENWKREKKEVKALLSLLNEIFEKKSKRIEEKEVSVSFVGSLNRFSLPLQKSMKNLEEKTKGNKMHVHFAISYGGRDEILQAVKETSRTKTEEEIQEMTEEDFGKILQTKNIPDPEIIIRTGGNKRLSNFLLWKSLYAEIFFVEKLWPEFEREDLENVLEEYQKSVQVNNGK